MKKVLLPILVAVMLMVTLTTKAYATEGEVQLPSISQLDSYSSYSFLKDPISEENLLVREYDNLKIVKASEGRVLQTFQTNSFQTFTANDDNTYFVTAGDYGYYGYLTIFNNYGEKVFMGNKIFYKGEEFYSFDEVVFIPNTNILVMTSNYSTKLLGFDVDRQEVVFSRNITLDSEMKVTSEYIALSGDGNEVSIYNTKGEYIDTIQADLNIESMKFTADGNKLVLGGDSDQLSVYDVDDDFEKMNFNKTQFKLNSGETFNFIDIDQKGKYLLALIYGNYNYKVRIFDFNTGQRIYSNLDSIDYPRDASISSDGKYIIVNRYIYDGKNLIKRVTDITIPTKYQTLELGAKNALSLQATLANGTTKEITSGITWATSNFNIGYLDSGKLVAQKTGSFDLKAKYLGLEATIKVTVKDTKPPVITGVNNITVPLGQPFNPRTGVTAQDLGDGNVTNKIIITGTVNVNKEGKYILTYTVKDNAGNSSKITRTVTVKKTLASNFYTYEGSDGDKFIVHKGVYSKKGDTLYKRTFAPYFYNSVKKKNLIFEAEIKQKSSIYMKKIIITAGKKKFSQKVNDSALIFNTNSENYYFKPSQSLITFLKKNVTAKQTVKIKFEGYYGSISYSLNSKQKAAISDSLKYVGY